MGSADRIERERVEKRTRILDAARALILERGFEAVTLREIAQRIEYSTTAIYVHFKDKADLIKAMLDEDFAKFAEGLERTVSVADPVERLGRLHHAYVDFALAMPHHYRLLFLTPMVNAHPDKMEPTGIEGYRTLRATLDECMQAGLLRPALTDVDALAQTVWASVHGLVSLLIVMGEHASFRWRDPATLTRTQLDTILHGILRDPPPPPKRRSKTAR